MLGADLLSIVCVLKSAGCGRAQAVLYQTQQQRRRDFLSAIDRRAPFVAFMRASGAATTSSFSPRNPSAQIIMFSWANNHSQHQQRHQQRHPDQEADDLIQAFDGSIAAFSLSLSNQVDELGARGRGARPFGLVLLGDADASMGATKEASPASAAAVEPATAATEAASVTPKATAAASAAPKAAATKGEEEDDDNDDGEAGRDLPLWVVEYVVAPEDEDDGDDEGAGAVAAAAVTEEERGQGSGSGSGRGKSGVGRSRRGSGEDSSDSSDSSDGGGGRSSAGGSDHSSGGASIEGLPAAPTHRADASKKGPARKKPPS